VSDREPLRWQWQRVLQLAADGLRADDAAQNESDSTAIQAVSAWLSGRDAGTESAGGTTVRMAHTAQYMPAGSTVSTAPGPSRRPQPKKHLDAHLVPVEQAFLERSRVLGEEAAAFTDSLAITPSGLTVAGARAFAEEFRKLAAELYHW
jgi:hypothetical protein